MKRQQFYSHAEVPPVKLLFSGEEECPPSHEFGGKRPYLIIHAVIKGKGSFYWERRSWSLEAGDAFVIFPEEKHLYRADKDDPWHYFWLALDGALVPYLRDHGISQNRPVLRTEHMDEIYKFYHSLIPLGGKKAAGWEMGQYAHVYGILAELLSHHINPKSLPSSEVRPDHVKTMKVFIDNYFQSPLSVKDVVSNVHLERSYASRLFKEGLGSGIAGYIRSLRLEKSREYLKEGFTVKQAAYSAGFQKYENYLKLFKKTYGQTPGAFQKSCLEKS